MIRATTPIHKFVFDEDPDENFSKLLVTYSQDDTIILEKDKEDMEFSTETDSDNNTIYIASIRLSQSETILFSVKPSDKVEIQIRALTYAGEALASDIKTINVKDVLNDEVLS